MSVEIPFRAPYLGEHNQEILHDFLGYDAARIAALNAAGTLVEDPQLASLRAEGRL